MSAPIAENAILNEIGKKTNIVPITMQVAIKIGVDAKRFTFLLL